MAGRVAQPVFEALQRRRHPDRAGRRAGRVRTVGHGLRAVPVRVLVRHHAVREPDRRRAVGRTKEDRSAGQRGPVRVRVQDVLVVRARGRHQDTASDGRTETDHVGDHQR